MQHEKALKESLFFFRFGNIYEYRSAFFSDVMYSNNVPGREGSLTHFIFKYCEMIVLSILLSVS